MTAIVDMSAGTSPTNDTDDSYLLFVRCNPHSFDEAGASDLKNWAIRSNHGTVDGFSILASKRVTNATAQLTLDQIIPPTAEITVLYFGNDHLGNPFSPNTYTHTLAQAGTEKVDNASVPTGFFDAITESVGQALHELHGAPETRLLRDFDPSQDRFIIVDSTYGFPEIDAVASAPDVADSYRGYAIWIGGYLYNAIRVSTDDSGDYGGQCRIDLGTRVSTDSRPLPWPSVFENYLIDVNASGLAAAALGIVPKRSLVRLHVPTIMPD